MTKAVTTRWTYQGRNARAPRVSPAPGRLLLSRSSPGAAPRALADSRAGLTRRARAPISSVDPQIYYQIKFTMELECAI